MPLTLPFAILGRSEGFGRTISDSGNLNQCCNLFLKSRLVSNKIEFEFVQLSCENDEDVITISIRGHTRCPQDFANF